MGHCISEKVRGKKISGLIGSTQAGRHGAEVCALGCGELESQSVMGMSFSCEFSCEALLCGVKCSCQGFFPAEPCCGV